MQGFVVLLTFLVLLCATPLQADGPGFHGDVRVGIFPFSPINYIDNDGRVQGFNPDLLREISRLQGWSLTFVPGSWSEGLERLQGGDIDLVMSVIYTPERAELMDYTVESVLEVWGQVFVSPESAVQGIADLAGKRVALMRGDMNGQNFKKTATELGVTCEFIEFAGFSEVFAAVRDKAVFAGVAPQHFGLRKSGDYDLVPSSIQFSPVPLYFAARKAAQHSLLSQIDVQLNSWKKDKDSYYYERLSYWLGVQQVRTEILPPWLLGSLAGFVALALLLLFMGLLLKSQVKKRTGELSQSNAELLGSRERYRKLITTMVQPMALHEIICGPGGVPVDYRFLEVNPAFEEFLARPAAEIVGKRVLELMPSTEPRWIDSFGKVALSGGALHFQDYSAELDQHFDVAAYSPEPGQFVAITTDITARIRMEAEQRRIEEQVLQTQKLESLGVLAGGIAHDFNNILMAVLGHCELALRRLPKESPAISSLEHIKNSAGKAADLANQMLAYSGKGKFVVEPHDLTSIIEEMEQMLTVSVSKKVVLRYEFAPHLPAVEADLTQIRQIILNLVINASDAIGDRSGVVAVSTGVMDCDRAYLAETWLDEKLPDGQYVFLEVADNGCGIDPLTIKRIFEPFFSTKFTGRGLGMAAVLGIVRGHKGAIKVYSEIGKGTTFKVLLPAGNRAAAIYDQPESLPTFKGSGLVLLVDDDETVLSVSASMLRELGFEVLVAKDGREAVQVYADKAQDISFVLTDLTMPHLDGEQAFREMRRINPSVKVILCSGYNEQEVSQKFVGKGLAGFLKKPYPLSALQEAVSQLAEDEYIGRY